VSGHWTAVVWWRETGEERSGLSEIWPAIIKLVSRQVQAET
jgi:hypothetical protein